MFTIGNVALAIFGLLTVLVTAWVLRSRYSHKRLLAAASAELQRAFTGYDPIPTLKVSYPYGYPAFTLGFASKAESVRAAASGALDRFKRHMQQVCADSGTKERPFNIERAVEFDYPERRQEILERTQEIVDSVSTLRASNVNKHYDA